MRLLFAASLLALGAACANFHSGPVKTEVVTYPPGGTVEFNGLRVGRSPAAVILPQDTNGKLTERAVFRAVPNTEQSMLYVQSRVLDPGLSEDRVPDRILIDMTLHDTNAVVTPLVSATHVESAAPTNKVVRKRPVDRGKPTQPVGLDRWSPGIY